MNGPHEQYVVQDVEARESALDRHHVIPTIWTHGTPPAPRPGSAAEREALIARSIEVDIIPRLLMAHLERPLAPVPVRPVATVIPVIDDAQIAAFADLVIHSPLQVAIERVSDLVQNGVSLDSIFSNLLAGSARLLGQRWAEDDTSFLDVTLGLANLQQLLRRFGQDFESVARGEPNGCRLLLSAMPGEAHTFGLAVVEEYFRRDGWTVTMEMPHQAQSLLNVLKESWYDVIGLSVGNAEATTELRMLIRDIRKASMNGAIRVMVGGSAVLIAGENLKSCGADMFAASAENAVRDARQFVMNARK